MDLSMPGAGGLESIRRLALHDPQVRILALTALEAGAYPHRVFKAGALGYPSKRGAPGALIDAVRTVAAGRRYLDAEMAQRMAMARTCEQTAEARVPARCGSCRRTAASEETPHSHLHCR